MSDFSITTTIDEGGPDLVITTTGSGAVMSSDFGGEVMFNVTEAFQSMNTDNPHVGTMLITGADGASITLTALDALTVQLVVDLNDGNEPQTIDLPWTDLTD